MLNQSYKNIKLLIIYDGSPDNCGETCEEYNSQDKRIVVFHVENSGVARTRNIDLEKASGDYISFVDSDDYVDPDMLTEMFKALSKSGQI